MIVTDGEFDVKVNVAIGFREGDLHQPVMASLIRIRPTGTEEWASHINAAVWYLLLREAGVNKPDPKPPTEEACVEALHKIVAVAQKWANEKILRLLQGVDSLR